MTEKDVLSRLQRQCSRREYCTRNVRAKAMRLLEEDVEAVGRVIADLQKEKYVDDLRYASAYAREKAHLSGWGPVKVGRMLAMKGIGRAEISAALGEVDAATSDKRLLKLLETKYKSLREDPSARLKLLRFALSRGYEYDIVEPAVKAVMKGEDD